jgi:hypothetical protein
MILVNVAAVFNEVKATRNAEYVSLLFTVPELYKGQTFTPNEPNLRFVVKSVVAINGGFVPGKNYNCRCDVGVESPRTDEVTGKTYSAKLRWNLIDSKVIESR